MIIIESNDNILESAERFAELTAGYNHIAFHGAMGAGKTTFISALCRVLGAEDEASSPTFSLVNEYVVPGDKSIYHFDFYRIESQVEAMDMGLDDYWDSGSLCLMEWPENIEEFLPEDTLHVNIIALPGGEREISW